MGAILAAAKVTQAAAANRMGYTPSTFSRHLNPEGETQLSLVFCRRFANEFCHGDISLLLDDEEGNNSVVARAFDMYRVSYGLPPHIMEGIYNRAVSEGDAFRELLKKKGI